MPDLDRDTIVPFLADIFARRGGEEYLGEPVTMAQHMLQGATFAAVPQLNISLEDRALANGGIAQTGNIGNALGTPAMLAVVATGADTGLPALLIGCYASAIIVHLALARGRANAERCSAPKS